MTRTWGSSPWSGTMLTSTPPVLGFTHTPRRSEQGLNGMIGSDKPLEGHMYGAILTGSPCLFSSSLNALLLHVAEFEPASHCRGATSRSPSHELSAKEREILRWQDGAFQQMSPRTGDSASSALLSMIPFCCNILRTRRNFEQC
eukprot:3127363-Amphidinium_carterae.1